MLSAGKVITERRTSGEPGTSVTSGPEKSGAGHKAVVAGLGGAAAVAAGAAVVTGVTGASNGVWQYSPNGWK